MLYVKGIFGKVYHPNFTLSEGQVGDLDESVAKTSAVKEMEANGIIKIFDNYEAAVDFKYRGYKALALESLPYLNPPRDEETGESLLKGSPTMILLLDYL
jgi:hypothetical protein